MQSSQIDIQETSEGLTVSMQPGRTWPRIVFLGCWFAGWAVGECIVAAMVLLGEGLSVLRIAALAWLGCWTMVGHSALRALLWELFGREVVEIDAKTLRIREQIDAITRTIGIVVGVEDPRGCCWPKGPRP